MNREAFEKHAAPQSIMYELRRAEQDQRRATMRVTWLSQLLSIRIQQIASGLWPANPDQVHVDYRIHCTTCGWPVPDGTNAQIREEHTTREHGPGPGRWHWQSGAET